MERERYAGDDRRSEGKQRPTQSLVFVMIIIKMAHGIHKHFPVRAGEWALAFMLFFWGLVLSGPDPVFSKSASYDGLARVASEQAWAIGCLLVGFIRLTALFINGSFADTRYGKFSPHVRGILAFASCFFWAQITVGMIRPDGSTTGLAVYPVLLVFDLWNAARAWFDAGQADGVKIDGGA